jgi:diacylglycerol kinase family enzyme
MGIPAFVNPDGGRARAALDALEADRGFDIRLAGPQELARGLKEAVAAGASRVLVAGGDGTVELAAAALAGTPAELAVLPGGTLNHFARDHGIPVDAEQSLALARGGTVRTTDVGYVNDRLFINTSSVGAYIRYVRARDRIERFSGYWVASLLAGLRVLASPGRIPVQLEVEGETRRFETPLVFVGVGERELGLPGIGRRKPGGVRSLHVVLFRGREQARRFSRAYGRVHRGLEVRPRALGVDAALVQSFRLDLPAGMAPVATDGEIKPAAMPLVYRYAPDALRVVVPESDESATSAPVRAAASP